MSYMKKKEKQQEKFITNLIAGMTQRQAYLDAFPDCKAKPETIDNKACTLFKSNEVQARYRELLEKSKAEAERKAIMTANERREWLSKVINGELKETILIGGEETPVKSASLSDKMKAMDILNKMDGEYVTKIQGDIGVSKKLEDLL